MQKSAGRRKTIVWEANNLHSHPWNTVHEYYMYLCWIKMLVPLSRVKLWTSRSFFFVCFFVFSLCWEDNYYIDHDGDWFLAIWRVQSLPSYNRCISRA